MTDAIRAEAVITHKVGLHARPSVKLTKLAKTLGARVEIASLPDGPWIDARSIVKVMALKIPQGNTLYLRGSGAGAAQAVEALVDLVRRDFDLAGTGDDAGGH